MSRLRNSLLVVLGIAALAIPAGAIADHGESHGKAKGHAKSGKAKGHANGNGKGQAKPHAVGYLFKGLYAGEGTVEVKGGNAHVRKGGFIGETVEFDLTDARLVVGDTNENGERDIGDVEEGDWVLVKARLPRNDPGSEPFEAKWLNDKTNKPAPDEEDEEEEENGT